MSNRNKETIALCPVPATEFRRQVEEAQANAEFIVRAVNNHDALVETCSKAFATLNAELGHALYTSASPSTAEAIKKAMRIIRDALATAKHT